MPGVQECDAATGDGLQDVRWNWRSETMLILQRRLAKDFSECIVLDLPDGERIIVTWRHQCHGTKGQVDVGIEAPQSVRISRAELDNVQR